MSCNRSTEMSWTSSSAFESLRPLWFLSLSLESLVASEPDRCYQRNSSGLPSPGWLLLTVSCTMINTLHLQHTIKSVWLTHSTSEEASLLWHLHFSLSLSLCLMSTQSHKVLETTGKGEVGGEENTEKYSLPLNIAFTIKNSVWYSQFLFSD